MEAVHVELPDEAVHLGMPEVSWQHHLLQLADVLDHELSARWRPVDNLSELIVLSGGRGTLRISKVLAINPATSAGYSIEREDIYNANNFKEEQVGLSLSRGHPIVLLKVGRVGKDCPTVATKSFGQAAPPLL